MAAPVYPDDVNPTGDPLGGGPGYSDIKTTGDHICTTPDEFVTALANATTGQIIYIAGTEIWDMDGYAGLTPTNPGVTIASNRGFGGSLGALLHWDSIIGSVRAFNITVANTRITGLRVQGPEQTNTNNGNSSHGVRGVTATNMEVDNCEIYGWEWFAVGVYTTGNHIHHNYIHHNQRPGLGYGVVMSSGGGPIIEANVFNYCRHATAATGAPGSDYIIRYNDFGPETTHHVIDMHGDGAAGPVGTDCDEITASFNLIRDTSVASARNVHHGGRPRGTSTFTSNWFATSSESNSFSQYWGSGGGGTPDIKYSGFDDITITDSVYSHTFSAFAETYGDVRDAADESDVVTGGKIIILRVFMDTFVDGATFGGIRQDIIDNLTSAQSESTGWNTEVQGALGVNDVTRLDDSTVEIILPPVPNYAIADPETITPVIPASALVTSASAVTSTTSFTITALSNPVATFTPHANWDGTAGSGWGGGAEAAPTDPTRVNGKPACQNIREEHVEITKDYQLTVDAFAALPRTNLDGALNDVSGTITVDSTADFPSSGNLVIGTEKLTYTDTTPTTFTGVTRGVGTTTAASHLDNAKVMAVHKTGVSKVTFYLEGTKTDVTDVAYPADILDTKGSGTPPPAYIATIDSSAITLDGPMQWYAEAVPIHQQLENKVIGPFVVYHNRGQTLANSGTVYWCDDGAADDTTAGTFNDPLKTINGVLTKHFGSNADASGVTIKCKAGSYKCDLNGSGDNHADGRPIIVTRDPAATQAQVVFDQASTAILRAAHVKFLDVTLDHTAGRLFEFSTTVTGGNELTWQDCTINADALVDPSPWTRIFKPNPLAAGAKVNMLNCNISEVGYWGKSDHGPLRWLMRGCYLTNWNADVYKSHKREVVWNNVRMHLGRTPSDGTHSDIWQITNSNIQENTIIHNVRIWDYNHQGAWTADTGIFRDSAFVNVLLGYNQNALHQFRLGDRISHVIWRNFACLNRWTNGDGAALGSTINDRINCICWKVLGADGALSTTYNSNFNNYHEDLTRDGDDPNSTNVDQDLCFADRVAFCFEEGSSTPDGITLQDWDVYGNRRDPDMSNIGPFAGAAEGTVTPPPIPPEPDTEAPTVPGTATAGNISVTQNDIYWFTSTDNVQVDGYEIFSETTSGFTAAGTNLIAFVTHPGTTYQHKQLTPDTTYYYVIRATDINGNKSAVTSEFNAATGTPPSRHGPIKFIKTTGGHLILETEDPS